MLLNDFLKERKKVEQTIAQLKSDATKQEGSEVKSTVAQQQKAIEELTAQPQYSIRRRNVKCLRCDSIFPS
jgi:hypothetical protein